MKTQKIRSNPKPKKIKSIKKRKKTPRQTSIEVLDKLLALFVKERDKHICQHCGKIVSGSNCQASHILSKGKYPALRWNPENIKTLCHYCHMSWWHKEPLEATEWFKTKFPERYEYLMEEKQIIKKISLIEINELIEYYEKKLKELK